MPSRNQKISFLVVSAGVLAIAGVLTWRISVDDRSSSENGKFSSTTSYAVGEFFSTSSSTCPDQWVPQEKYYRGDLALFPDQVYVCRRNLCKDKGWFPIGPCITSPTPDPTQAPSGECPNLWNPNLAFSYDKGDEVTLDGILYYCRNRRKCQDASNVPGDASDADNEDASPESKASNDSNDEEFWLPLGPCPFFLDGDCPDEWIPEEEYDLGEAVQWMDQLYVCLDDDDDCEDEEPGSNDKAWRLMGPCTTESPTRSPSFVPSSVPSISGKPSISSSPSTSSPTNSPTSSPTTSPTISPTSSPTTSPTNSPTTSPTTSPTASPTNSPTTSPTNSPTDSPTSSPTNSPTTSPTNVPSSLPSMPPSDLPSLVPSQSPSTSVEPSSPPTTSFPTFSPTFPPTDNPTANPTVSPTESPTTSPFAAPSGFPSTAPFAAPSESPTYPFPTFSPTVPPTLP